jgi:hypothetical protein
MGSTRVKLLMKGRSKGPVRPRAGAKSAGAKRPRPAGEVVIPTLMKPVVAAFSGSKAVTVEKGWGSNSVALKTRGKIFAMLVRGDLVFKLPSARVDELVGGGGGKRFDPRHDGREMKEWLVVPLSARDRVKLARQAFEFVSAGGA